nr:hypothetical protein [Tanacetum cinerariifolium]
MIRLRAEAPSTSHPPPPIVLPHTKASVAMLRVKRLCIALGLRFKVGESSSAPTARPTGDTWDEMLKGMSRASTTDETELGRRMTYFVTTVRQDTDEIYRRLDDAQEDRVLMIRQLNMMRRDTRSHACTA